MRWSEILPGVYRFQDSCNVYALVDSGRALIVDAGTGAWLDHAYELPATPVALVCTHYFRDHSAGAARAAAAGIPVWAPQHEADILADPAEHFRSRQTYIIYDNLWDLFAPIEPVPISGRLLDYARMELGGLTVEVLPLPGATVGQTGLLINHPASGRRIALVGETIHSPGRLPRVAPLQYNYNDLGGAACVYYSLNALRKHRPDVLLPSLGEPMLDGADAAMELLMANLRQLVAGRPGMLDRFDRVCQDRLRRVTDHLWIADGGLANAHFLISKSGRAMVLDYGYSSLFYTMPSYATQARRRPLLHSLDALREQTGIEKIDVALISHFHDDHVSAVPLLQRLHGTQCWAAETFADLLDHPAAHCFPCNWPAAPRVDRRLAMDQPFEWEEYRFHVAPMTGHTHFAALIGFKADGKRIAHTGDQYLFQKGADRFDDNAIMQNHVYRNGCLLDGYAQSGRWLLEFRPDIVVQGHQGPMFTDAHFFKRIADWTNEFEKIHRDIMPLGETEPHFNVDSWGGWIWPYRTHLRAPGTADVRVTVRNPLPHPANLEVRLVGPAGWRGESVTLSAAARAEVSCHLQITPNGPCRRQLFAAELTADGRPFGQIAEAMITVGGKRF